MKPKLLKLARSPLGTRDSRRPAGTLFAGLLLTVLAVSGLPASVTGQTPGDLWPSTIILWQKTAPGGNDDIYAAAPDGSGLRQLTFDSANDQYPALSPDGRRVAFVSDRSGGDRIYVMDADGTNVKPVPLGSDVQYAAGPAWSPDGKTLAFAGSTQFAGNFDIYIVKIDGAGLRRLTTSLDFEAAPTWSPDGIRIAFHRQTAGNYDIYTINILTLEETRLTVDTQQDISPAWSPDGRSIAFSRTELGISSHIYTMDPDGGNLADVTPDSGYYAHPAWSPDGRELAVEYYLSPVINIPDIYRIRLDPFGVFVVSTDPAASERSPSWGVVSLPVADLNLESQGVEVQLLYQDREWTVPAAPSATGADYWIAGNLKNPDPRVVVQDLGRIQDSATLYGVNPGSYRVVLWYGPAPTGGGVQRGGVAAAGGQMLLETHADAVVQRNQTTVVKVDLSREFGVIAGGMTLNGAAPGPGLALFVAGGSPGKETYVWRMDLPATGQFRLLLPQGAGYGVICSPEVPEVQEMQRAYSGYPRMPSVTAYQTATALAGRALFYQPFTFNVQRATTVRISP